ncbi:MAG: DNA translocase FtsK 4TM domain-containing protein [bacterium]
MAKKKKRSSKKQVRVEREPNMFLRGVWAVMLFVVALFLLIGSFGQGGPLPKGMFSGVYSVFGWAAYFAPVSLVFWGVYKFKTEEHKIPFLKILSMLMLLVTGSSLLHATFATQTINASTATTVWTGGHGGSVGKLFGGLGLAIFSKYLAAIILLITTILVFCWTFGVPMAAILYVLKAPFKNLKNTDKDTDLSDLKEQAAEKGFKLTEGVPFEQSTSRSSLKNSVPKVLLKEEDHQALTAANDADWQIPPIALLNQKQDKANAGDVNGNADIIRETFENFNYEVEMEGANVGPRVTQYTIKAPAGVKLSKIAALDDNLAYSLAAQSIRIEAPIPGQKAVGIEVPNLTAATVRIASVLESEQWKTVGGSGKLGFVVGRDIAGIPVVANLEKMPHVLIAGQTNSGKSVMVNTLLTSLLYRNSPSDMKLILVDPKHVELNIYNDIPHLLTPVITEPEKCISALKWAVSEMERRYRALAADKKRNIEEYNTSNAERMPYIIIVIDELADLMMMAARDVESLIVRIAQKARAVGIHLVLATQRPSVDVITGLIKANIPARIAFTVASQIDSRTIIDGAGAEKLLGMGDMLFSTADMPKPKRVQGALITLEETQKVTDFLRMQRPPQYDDEVVSQPVQLNGKGGVVADYSAKDSADDDMWEDAVKTVIDNKKASTSLLQRRLRIGYGRASRLIDQMEEQGIVGSASGAKPRDVLVRSMDEVFGTDAPDEEDSVDIQDQDSGPHPFDDVLR